MLLIVFTAFGAWRETRTFPFFHFYANELSTYIMQRFSHMVVLLNVIVVVTKSPKGLQGCLDAVNLEN